MVTRYCIALCFILIAVAPCLATTWYANPNATGTGDGKSWANALTSIQLVNDSVRGGDTVYFYGTFTDTTLYAVGGTANDWTAYISGDGVTPNKAAAGNAIFDHGTAITNWGFYGTTASGDTIWMADASIVRPKWDSLEAIWVDDSIPVHWAHSGGVGSLSLVDGTCDAGALCWPHLPFYEFYWDPVADSVYAYFGTDNPNNMKVVGYKSRKLMSIDEGGDSYIYIYGINMRYAAGAIPLTYGNAQTLPDYITIDSCSFRNFGERWTGNSSAIYISAPFGWPLVDDDDHASHITVRRCTFREITAFDGAGYHGSALVWYSCDTSVIEYNDFYGLFGGYVLMLKNQSDTAYDYRYDLTIRYNRYHQTDGAGAVWLWFRLINAKVYGNVIDTRTAHVFTLGHEVNITRRIATDSSKIYNNTIVCRTVRWGQGSSQWVFDNGENLYQGLGNEVKYNVVVFDGATATGQKVTSLAANDTTGYVNPVGGYGPGDTVHWVFDSNMYYYFNDTSKIRFEAGGSGLLSLDQWKVRFPSWDQNSVIQDPGFADFANNDFSRPSASNEMDTTYGGQRWTIYGALQPAATPGTTIVIQGNVGISGGVRIE